MSDKSYVSEERLEQFHENIVEAPIVTESEAEYLIGVKDGKLYRVEKSVTPTPASINANVGDVIFYDSQEDKKIAVAVDDVNVNDYPLSRYTPIGVCAIPTSHDVYGTGECGVVSLKAMAYSTPDDGSTSNGTMIWGYSLLLGNAYNVVVQTGTQGSPTEEASGTNSNPYLPSDIFSGGECPTDPEAFYSASGSKAAAPSPYLTDGGRNPVYYQTESPSSEANALSDFDGVGDTQLMLDAVTVDDWKTADTIANSSSEGNYPTACCCWRFHTEGTEQGDWYLPACGEVGYVMVRLKKINETIDALISAYGSAVGVALATSNYLCSSSEYGSGVARVAAPDDGNVNNVGKSFDATYVRAFLRV